MIAFLSYLFRVKAIASRSEPDILIGDDVLMYVCLENSGATRLGTATASNTGGSDVPGCFQVTVYGKEISTSPVCDPFAIRKAVILPEFRKQSLLFLAHSHMHGNGRGSGVRVYLEF